MVVEAVSRGLISPLPYVVDPISFLDSTPLSYQRQHHGRFSRSARSLLRPLAFLSVLRSRRLMRLTGTPSISPSTRRARIAVVADGVPAHQEVLNLMSVEQL